MIKMDQAAYTAKAAEMWEQFDKNERTGVRFGMFPAKKMQAAEKEGYGGKDLAVALMNVASSNGGMRA
ncbi:MAG: hypothetical protein KJZ92_14150 [Rhodocyclaceae bacterium]|nr:hypothetical protein [Rhodocyclaceae bacterium]